MHDRRRDPRTSKPFSLANLLRTRAETEGLLLAVLATTEGFVMASSRDANDSQTHRIAAHVSQKLASGRTWISVEAPSWPAMKLLALRFEADGRPAFVAVLVAGTSGFDLEALASCARRILAEPAQGRLAA